MTANRLYPAFVRINYASAYGPHVMTLPSVPINDGGAGVSGFNFDLRGGALPVDVDGAVKAFVNLLKPFFSATTTFIDYTAFTMATPDALAVPVYSGALNITGTEGLTTIWAKATQSTWTFRADDFTLFKLVLLDTRVESFDKKSVLTEGSQYDAVRDYVTADVTWLASRGGGRPATFLQISHTLNEKLRRAYKMN